MVLGKGMTKKLQRSRACLLKTIKNKLKEYHRKILTDSDLKTNINLSGRNKRSQWDDLQLLKDQNELKNVVKPTIGV